MPFGTVVRVTGLPLTSSPIQTAHLGKLDGSPESGLMIRERLEYVTTLRYLMHTLFAAFSCFASVFNTLRSWSTHKSRCSCRFYSWQLTSDVNFNLDRCFLRSPIHMRQQGT